VREAPRIGRFAPHEWRGYRELRLRALADSPDAFGSTLARESAFADELWRERIERGARSPSDLPLVARIGTDMVGMAWGRLEEADPGDVHVYQVWVAPEHRGRGVGQALLDAIIAWARSVGARRISLDATCGNTAAMRLYTRAGFLPVGDPEPLRPGSGLMKQGLRLELL
jgi:ribosomal protein S18 acetylase RimI-like enzyme